MYNQDIHQRIVIIRHRTVHRVDIQVVLGSHRRLTATPTIPIKDTHLPIPRIPAAMHPTVKLTVRMARRQPTVLMEGNLTEDNRQPTVLMEEVNLITVAVSVNRPTVNRLTVNRPSVNLFNRPSHRHRRSPSSNRADPASVSWPRKRWSTPV